MPKLIPFLNSQRECGSCTKCCEGWNVFNIQGRSVKPGTPCYFLANGCSIYEHRPAYPCKEYNCEWMNQNKIPDEFKPSECGVIINKMMISHIDVFVFTPAPNDPSEKMIEWAKEYFKDKNWMHYDKNGVYAFGDKNFVKMIKNIPGLSIDRFYQTVIKLRESIPDKI